MSAGAGSQQGVTTVGPDGRVVSRWEFFFKKIIFRLENLKIMSHFRTCQRFAWY